MYSKQEAQQLKQEFWIAFAEKYPRKWLLYDTKIKDFSLKFFVDNKKAQVLIDIEPRNDETRYAYFEKIEALKNILEEDHIQDLVYYRDFTLESGKTISRIFVEKDGLSVSNRNHWDAIFDFLAEKMNALELAFYEFEDYIKDI
ncbi:DUF4268 domain-containing protein [Flavobacterium sp.]|uniref:DUF4268 domain-containing protein n=1 Tax=Flavobacterium sp. TaxID=239 RepID=UPI0039E5B98D